MNHKLELASLIETLRKELSRAQSASLDKSIRFGVKEVELELEIAVEEGKETGVNTKFYVLTTKFKKEQKDEVTQRIKLKLEPMSTENKEKQGNGTVEVSYKGTK
uniref:Trypsin-co-occurring domain-containing protein n=1 Tax=Candidatus Kentrum sp. MB TaxID=2138164 RepID=A0A451BA19_9GAMM|nr:MAG: hypothetical protein BECKMB1821I_GA0114274_10145 [Candidatus Kentron sp. MB]VFK75124.1 MAG: hypothetical protein BECKMB1821H_GA0114242_10165 [Candidatus Kentron sp. MB]